MNAGRHWKSRATYIFNFSLFPRYRYVAFYWRRRLISKASLFVSHSSLPVPLARSPSMVFKYWIFVTFRIACLRMNSLKARLSWPEWQIKNGEFIERSHACILNRGRFASRNFILISGRACLYRADESLNFHRPYQAATLTKRGKKNSFASASRFQPETSILTWAAFLTIIYGEMPVMDEQDTPMLRRRR